MRVGFGYDVHSFIAGRPLILGGITVPYLFGLKGHSDADVLTHAICDALLGAIAEGDIGRHFPDTDPRYKDIRSTILLKNVLTKIREKGFHPVNIDATIVAQKPKLSDFIGRLSLRTGFLPLPSATNWNCCGANMTAFSGRWRNCRKLCKSVTNSCVFCRI